MNALMKTPIRVAPAVLLTAVFSMVLLLTIPVTASAQHNNDDTQQILDQTQEIIDQVTEIVMQSESEQARRILEDANQRQRQAREMHASGRSQFAVQMSMKARDAARQAERIARNASSYHDRALDYLERLQETHDNIKQRAQDSGNEMALRFVREAEQTFQRAREQYQQTRYDAAFTLLQTAERNLQRAARILFESGDAERLARELDNTEDLLNRASELMDQGTDRALLEMLDQARQALDDARRALTGGDPLRAMHLGRRSREQAQRILRQVNHAPDATTVQAQIDRFDAQQAGIAEQVQESGDARALDALRRAQELRDQAVMALQGGDAQLALRKIRSALDLQNRASELLR